MTCLGEGVVAIRAVKGGWDPALEGEKCRRIGGARGVLGKASPSSV